MRDTTSRRPYGAAANVIGVLARARTRNLPDVVNDDFLRISGVPEVVFGRVSEALRFLDLVGEDNSPTEKLREIARAAEEPYRVALARTVREAYQEDFSNVDPGQDGQQQIIDWFRRYEPRSQTARMVMLFLGLCREAGIPVKEAPRERKMQGKSRQGKVPSVRSRGSSSPAGRGSGGSTPDPSPGTLFGVTESDIAALDEQDFAEVWAALGKVARARARTNQRSSEPADREQESADEEELGTE
jgi:hypothetical protein